MAKREVFYGLYQQHTGFVTRLNIGSKYKLVEELEDSGGRTVGSLALQKDLKIQLTKGKYKWKEFNKEEFRLITTINSEDGKEYWFLTNLTELSAEEVLGAYKKRWDIEVFFRFLKQELNFSHITSTNPNGIAVMMYMTMITSMFVLMYKKLNKVGYKTAVRRMSLELNELIIKLIVHHCGGDPALVFR